MCDLFENKLSDAEVEHLFEYRKLIGKKWTWATTVYRRGTTRFQRCSAGSCWG